MYHVFTSSISLLRSMATFRSKTVGRWNTDARTTSSHVLHTLLTSYLSTYLLLSKLYFKFILGAARHLPIYPTLGCFGKCGHLFPLSAHHSRCQLPDLGSQAAYFFFCLSFLIEATRYLGLRKAVCPPPNSSPLFDRV
jgi:hypothetical protein